jgi:DNA invertase Pin-like site-specific DNA recombinase
VPDLTPAVGYCRRSSVQQDVSIDRQKDELVRLAERTGHEIIRWYTDSKSGDDAKRPGFESLMKSVKSPSCDFDAILVFDQGRFSRLDKDRAGVHFLALRDCGVALISCIEGVIVNPDDEDNDLGDSIKRDINQYTKHKFLKDLAETVASGKLRQAKSGIIGGPINYACRRRQDKRLEAGDPRQIKVLRWMFDQADADWTPTAIARRLNQDMVPSPRGGRWSQQTVAKILQNRIYIADRKYGRRHNGKHVRVTKAGVIKVRHRDRAAVVDDPDGGIEPDVPNFVGKPLIPIPLFDRVQKKMQSRARGKRDDPRSLPLARGIAKCGLCGADMCSVTCVNGGRQYRYYRCDAAQQYAKGVWVHTNYSVPADWLWKQVVAKLVDQMLSPSALKTISDDVTDILKARAKSKCSDLAMIDNQIASVSASLGTIKQNMLYATTPEAVSAFSAELGRLTAEVARLRDERRSVQALFGESARGIGQIAKRIVDTLQEMREALWSANEDCLVDAVRRLVERVECRVAVEKPKGASKWKVSLLEPEITLKSTLELIVSDSHAVCISRNNDSWKLLTIHTRSGIATAHNSP